jgi:dipeptidyl aminopeptidase/acylaminoacyl peptidase
MKKTNPLIICLALVLLPSACGPGQAAPESSPTQLFVPADTPVPPAATPTGEGRIAFDSDRDGNAEIYLMNADGTEATRLTDNPAGDAFPSWSPDATQIAFSSYRDGNRELYVMNADGSGQTNLTNNPADDEYASWSPS